LDFMKMLCLSIQASFDSVFLRFIFVNDYNSFGQLIFHPGFVLSEADSLNYCNHLQKWNLKTQIRSTLECFNTAFS
jgi:hypothetical protein